MKFCYTPASLEIVNIEANDIITTSGGIKPDKGTNDGE